MIMKPSVFDRALLWGLVLTLPLTPIKLVWGQYSLYVLFSLVLIVRVLGRALLGDRTIWRSVNRLDGLLFIYFGVVIFGVAVNYKDGAILILGKTLFYFAGYFSLKVQLNGMAAPAITDLLRKGCWAGLTLYLALMLYAMVVFDVSLEFSQYSYNNFALKIFKPMVSVVSGQEDLESRDIMRNTLGEIFALYGVILLLTAKSARLKGLWGVFVATSLVLLTFSRRAFIQVAITCLLVVAGRREPFMRILIAVVLFSTVTIFVLLFEPALGVDVRVLQLIDQSRIEQFLAVLAPINDSLFIGQGYGAQFGGKYVHNFLLASFYMLGLAGGLIAVAIVAALAFDYLSSIRRASHHGYLLIFPILGLMVGSTVEGLFTPAAWVALALFGSMQKRPEGLLVAGDSEADRQL